MVGMVSRGNTGEVGGVRKLVWLAEQLFTSLSFSPSLSRSLSLFCFVFCRDDRGKALLLRVCIDRGPSKGGGRGTRRAGPFSTTAAPSAPPPPPPYFPPTPSPLSPPASSEPFSSLLTLKFKFKALILKG